MSPVQCTKMYFWVAKFFWVWTKLAKCTSGINAVIILKRRIMNELLTTYLPCFLILSIVYATNYFKPFFFEVCEHRKWNTIVVTFILQVLSIFWPRILRDLVNLTWWFSFFDSSSILCTGSGDGESDIPPSPHHAVYQCFRYSVYCQNFFSFWGYVLWTVVFRTRIILLRERENVQGLSA